ncbi:hypothetical protein B0T17DRAFT_586892 [Bombardia bombarda]|uniref:NTF2 domain-containing protein n=1 Tax=Bombardia bombarda TaxID=252184 RepID=A0AA40CFB7_9PEZI|nr:hypothetical protein B0T17DRAFT_586892 [Bombardia bombarda]
MNRHAAKTISFVDWYYQTVNDGKPVAIAYVNNNATYKTAAHPPADICVNGLVVATPEEWDKQLEQQRATAAPATTTSSGAAAVVTNKPGTASALTATVRYEVECYDVHVINRDYQFAAPAALLAGANKDDAAGARIMMMLTVSGTVTFGSDRSAVKQHFNDVFILVPNWDAIARHGSRSTRRYIISSHTYRAY